MDALVRFEEVAHFSNVLRFYECFHILQLHSTLGGRARDGTKQKQNDERGGTAEDERGGTEEDAKK